MIRLRAVVTPGPNGLFSAASRPAARTAEVNSATSLVSTTRARTPQRSSTATPTPATTSAAAPTAPTAHAHQKSTPATLSDVQSEVIPNSTYRTNCWRTAPGAAVPGLPVNHHLWITSGGSPAVDHQRLITAGW